MKQLKKTVIEILIKHPGTRDSDIYLYGYVLLRKGIVLQDIPATDLLRGMNSGKYPSLKSVSRVRAKIQESREDLRGNLYARRHRLQESIKAELESL